MKTNVGSLRIEYEDRGVGLPILLIHGYPLSRTLWEPQWLGFSDMARVIAPDLRGHGGTEPQSDETGEPVPYTVDLLAADCAELLDSLGINEPVIVGGLSMGGYVALAFYRSFAHRAAGLILAATRAGPDSPEAKENRDKAAALAHTSGSTAIAQSMLPKMLSPKTYAARPELVDFVLEMMQGTSVPGIVGALHAMRERPDSAPYLADIRVPTLLIHGADDQIISLSDMEAMHAAIPGSALRVIPNAGHLVNLEQPESFNHDVRGFLQTLPSVH